jgi:hypothetical protein
VVADDVWIESDFDNLGVTGFIGTNVFVSRIFLSAAHVAYRSGSDAGQSTEGSLNSPETACSKRG